mgnify:FL=1|jgi:hypothetical protein
MDVEMELTRDCNREVSHRFVYERSGCYFFSRDLFDNREWTYWYYDLFSTYLEETNTRSCKLVNAHSYLGMNNCSFWNSLVLLLAIR